MAFNRRHKQIATYWASPVSDGFGGSTFTAPKQLAVRWEEKAEEFQNTQGEMEVSQAVVFLGQDVDKGGYLFLGQSVAVDPTTLDGAFPIKRYGKIPDLRNVSNQRRAWL